MPERLNSSASLISTWRKLFSNVYATTILSCFLGSVFGFLVLGFLKTYWYAPVNFPNLISHASSMGSLSAEAKIRVIACYLPNWISAVLMGALIGRFLGRKVLPSALAFALGMTIVPYGWHQIETSFVWWRGTVFWRPFLLTLSYEATTVGLVMITALLVRRRGFSTKTGAFPVMHPDTQSMESTVIDSQDKHD